MVHSLIEMGEPAKKVTMEEVWAAIKASEDARREGEKALRESQRKGEAALREAQQRTEEAQQRTEEAQQKTEETLQQLTENLNKASGDFTNKWGQFLENLIEDDLVKLLNEQNIKVEEVFPRLVVKKSGVVTGEYDLVAVNGEEVVVVEVKTTLEKDDVGQFLKKLATFKGCVSAYKDKTVYGAIAYMGLKDPKKDKTKEFKQYKSAFEMAQEKGLFLIQSPGGAKDVSKIVNKEGFTPKVF